MAGSQLKRLREEYDITQERLANYMKVSLRELIDWENGTQIPDEEQMKRLYELFQLPYENDDKKEKQRIHNKDNNKKEPKNKKSRKARKGRKKRRRKSKNKTKVKTQKQTVVKKRRIWPLILFLVLLLGTVVVGGGYLYWKYGDQYTLTKKDTYKAEELTGTFTAEDAHDGTPSSVMLVSDHTFRFTVNSCDVMNTYTGSWKIDKKTITLTSSEGSTYTFTINSSNQLKYTSDTIGCGPYRNDIFNRGSIVQDPKPETDKEETPSVSLTTGNWVGENNTLTVSSVNESTMTFTLTSTNPDDTSQSAAITNITGIVNGHTVTFEFSDDGYGNAGTGTIVFDDTQAVFSITKTTSQLDTAWSIQDSGTLMKE